MKGFEVGDVVSFQVYEGNEPVDGKITRIGTKLELGMYYSDQDPRVFYELETVGKGQNHVFTRTTISWINKK